MGNNPDFVACPQNRDALNNYLLRHQLPPTSPNFQRAYDDLLAAGLIHTTRPLPHPHPGYRPSKGRVERYSGSHYDKTQIDRLREQMALMTADELKELQAINGWVPDFPHWLKS